MTSGGPGPRGKSGQATALGRAALRAGRRLKTTRECKVTAAEQFLQLVGHQGTGDVMKSPGGSAGADGGGAPRHGGGSGTGGPAGWLRYEEEVGDNMDIGSAASCWQGMLTCQPVNETYL